VTARANIKFGMIMPSPILNSSDLLAESSEDIAYAAWKKVLSSLKGAEDYAGAVCQLPLHWRAVYTTIHLEAEVQNGGHHQYFWNGEGELNDELSHDLRFIQALPFADLFAEALKVYKENDYASDKLECENSWEGFTAAYSEGRMGNLDNAFYEQPKSLAWFLGEFIRKNANLFTTDPTPSSDVQNPEPFATPDRGG